MSTSFLIRWGLFIDFLRKSLQKLKWCVTPGVMEFGSEGETWIINWDLPLISKLWSLILWTQSLLRVNIFPSSLFAGPREGKERSWGVERPLTLPCTSHILLDLVLSHTEVHVGAAFLLIRSPRLREVKWLVLGSTLFTQNVNPKSACCLSESFKKRKYLFSMF